MLLPEVSHSILTRFIAELEGKKVDMKFLKPFFKTGSLVDAILTEPEKWNASTGILLNHTRYQKEELFYSPDEITLVNSIVEAFRQDKIGRMFSSLASKIPFHEQDSFIFSYEGVEYAANLSGESDLTIPEEKIGSDIKVTACKTQKEFTKKVQELKYDQQGAIYSDALKLDHFVVIGVSRETIDLNTGLPAVFHYPMEKNCRRMKQGRERYSKGMYLYYKEKDCLTLSRKIALDTLRNAA